MKESITKTGFTIADICERYGVCRTTVYRWMRFGWLKPTMLGGRVYFSDKALSQFERRGYDTVRRARQSASGR